MDLNMDDEEDFDPIVEDCGESRILDSDDAKKQALKYNQILEERFKFRKIPSRTDPRSILHGL
jgi:hypothetical protein